MHSNRLDTLTEDFVRRWPRSTRNSFANDATWRAFRTLRDQIAPEDPMVKRLVEWAEATDAERDRIVADMRRKVGNRPRPKGRYMWGAEQQSIACGGGIRFASCSGHGGFLVSEAREAAIPEGLRRGQAYEEDDEFNIIALLWPSAALAVSPTFLAEDAEANGTTQAQEFRHYAAQNVLRMFLSEDVRVAVEKNCAVA